METTKPEGSLILRLVIIGAMILVLLVPMGMISALVNERQARKQEAVAEVASKWAAAQTIGGPVITVPYDWKWRDDDGKTQITTEYVSFLPENLQITTKLTPRLRYRGIYKVVLYETASTFGGSFDLRRLERLNLKPGVFRWREAVISLGIPDVRGIQDYVQLDLGGRSFAFEPGSSAPGGGALFASGMSVNIPLPAADRYDFAFSLNLKGSEEFNLLPLGRTTEVSMRAPWDNPSFDGAFLPDKREIDAQGFSAQWHVLDMNRSYPQQWVGDMDANNIMASKFGVKLISPVDEYTNASRAVKYAVMFVGLTFLIFFLVEIFNKRRIHPIQYLLVGLSLCLFYVLLLSLSEHLGFLAAYLIAALSVVGLITFYVASAVGGKIAAPVTAGMLTILYGFLYILLQNQDYALLLGSIGLFLIMAAVMYLSRKVDWYGLEARRASKPPADDTLPQS